MADRRPLRPGENADRKSGEPDETTGCCADRFLQIAEEIVERVWPVSRCSYRRI